MKEIVGHSNESYYRAKAKRIFDVIIGMIKIIYRITGPSSLITLAVYIWIIEKRNKNLMFRVAVIENKIKELASRLDKPSSFVATLFRN